MLSKKKSSLLIKKRLLFFQWVHFYSIQIIYQVWIGVRHWICKWHRVVRVFEVIGEAQSVVCSVQIERLFSNIVRKVLNVIATFEPRSFLVLKFQTWINRNFHSIIKETIWLRIIDDVELDLLALLHILDPEIKPLSMPLSVDIILH